jgi:putative membrane protein
MAPASSFRRQRLHQWLLGGYLILWAALAVSPVDRQDWLLENILTVGLLALLIATYRAHPLSNTSYVLIACFMALHAVGAHYTYAKVPFGFWLKDAMDLTRNHYDRIVHFAFGLLLAYPIREVLQRWAGARGPWSYGLAVAVIMAGSGLFEQAESWIAQIVSPELGSAYLGTQGDEWDAQKDETAAAVGALLAVLFMAAAPRILPRRVNQAFEITPG